GGALPMKRWFLLAALLVGCSHAAAPTSWIERAREAHQRADAALARGDLDGGRTALRDLVDAPAPGTITLEHRRVALHDALFRLAERENSIAARKRPSRGRIAAWRSVAATSSTPICWSRAATLASNSARTPGR